MYPKNPSKNFQKPYSFPPFTPHALPFAQNYSNKISNSDFKKSKGLIGHRSCKEVIEYFSVLGNMIKSFSEKKSKKKKIYKKEKEIRIGGIIFKPSKGDWMCNKTNCSNWNYSKRNKCNLCGAPNSAFFGDKSDFSDFSQREREKWKCSICGFSNCNRGYCYKCKEKRILK